MSDFSNVSSVIHEQEFDVVEVSDSEFLESGRKVISGLFVVSHSNLWHGQSSSESSSDSGINTSWLSP